MKRFSFILGWMACALFAIFATAKDYDYSLPSDGTYDIRWDGTHYVWTGDWRTSGSQNAAFDAEHGHGGSTTFTALKDSSISASIERNYDHEKGVFFDQAVAGKDVTIGVFSYSSGDLDRQGHLTEEAKANIQSNTKGVMTGTTGDTLITEPFHAGEMLGVYVVDNGNIYYSTEMVGNDTGEVSTDTSWGSGGPGKATFYFETDPGKKNLFGMDPEASGIIYTQYEVVIQIQAIASATSGGPLPGVWATMALAGVVGTYLKRRKTSLEKLPLPQVSTPEAVPPSDRIP